MDKMKIEIWSDIACPYCYIGKRKLENALNKFEHKDEVEIVWHSYELNPDMPKKALHEPFAEHFSKAHNMSIEDTQRKFDEITQIAKETGLNYNFGKVVAANTSDALRLVKLANTFDLADECEEVLFKAYFVEGQDISDRDTLMRLGKEIGLNEKRISNMLDGNVYFDEIKKDIEYSENELKLEFIPFYLINGKHAIQGSIAENIYLEVIEKAYEEWKTGEIVNEHENIVGGKSCSVDGVCS